jgi:hypothetical protein
MDQRDPVFAFRNNIRADGSGPVLTGDSGRFSVADIAQITIH